MMDQYDGPRFLVKPNCRVPQAVLKTILVVVQTSTLGYSDAHLSDRSLVTLNLNPKLQELLISFVENHSEWRCLMRMWNPEPSIMALLL